jgi:hypothetical protein
MDRYCPRIVCIIVFSTFSLPRLARIHTSCITIALFLQPIAPCDGVSIFRFSIPNLHGHSSASLPAILVERVTTYLALSGWARQTLWGLH